MGEEGLEDLLGWEAYLAGDGDGGEVFGIDFVGAKFVGDAEGVEEAGGVGLGWSAAVFTRRHSGLVEMIWPLRMVRVWSASGFGEVRPGGW